MDSQAGSPAGRTKEVVGIDSDVDAGQVVTDPRRERTESRMLPKTTTLPWKRAWVCWNCIPTDMGFCEARPTTTPAKEPILLCLAR